jgi:hypothetical protein
MKDTLEVALRKSMVSRAIFNVDESGSYYIANPYRNQPTASVAAIGGTYAVSPFTTTGDTLTVTEQVTYGEHIYEFEESLTRVGLWASSVDELSYAVAVRADAYVLNEVLANAGESYDTPVGGFTTAANWTKILSNLISKVAGYSQAFSSFFLVVENTDLVGILDSQMNTGFNFADSALRNGLIGNQANVEIYMVRTGTFVDATTTTASGTKTWTNSGKRMFGVKNVATYACPGGVHVDEKKVTLKTGRELSVWMNIGAKLWATKTNLICAITIK